MLRNCHLFILSQRNILFISLILTEHVYVYIVLVRIDFLPLFFIFHRSKSNYVREPDLPTTTKKPINVELPLHR